MTARISGQRRIAESLAAGATAADLTLSGNLTVSGRAALAYPLGGDVLGIHQDTGASPGVEGRCYAMYLGRAPARLTSVQVSCAVGATIAAGVSWAELALASGAFVPSSGTTPGSPALTTIASTSMAADIVIGTNWIVTKTITATVEPGTELWAMLAVSATTQPTWRLLTSDMTGRFVYRASTQPSTMAAGSTFTGGTLTVPTSIPWISVLA